MARSDDVVRYIDHLLDCGATDGLLTANQSDDRLTSVAGRQPAHQHQLCQPKTAQLNKKNTHESDTRKPWDACDRPPLPSPPLATAQKLVKGGSGIVGDMEVSCVDRSLGTIALS